MHASSEFLSLFLSRNVSGRTAISLVAPCLVLLGFLRVERDGLKIFSPFKKGGKVSCDAFSLKDHLHGRKTLRVTGITMQRSKCFLLGSEGDVPLFLHASSLNALFARIACPKYICSIGTLLFMSSQRLPAKNA